MPQPTRATHPTPRRFGPLERLFDRMIAPRPAFRPERKPISARQVACAQALVRAVEGNDEGQVLALLRDGADPQVLSPGGSLALNQAMVSGRWVLARHLVAHGADPRAPDGRGATAMGLAWLQARGGRELDPDAHHVACGEAAMLLSQWQCRFGVVPGDTMFGERHRAGLSVHQAQRVGAEAGPGGVGHEGHMGDASPWEDTASAATLLERRKARVGRMIPAATARHDPHGTILVPRVS